MDADYDFDRDNKRNRDEGGVDAELVERFKRMAAREKERALEDESEEATRLTSQGIGSGIPVAELVKANLDAARKPQEKRLNKEERILDDKIEAFTKVKKALLGLSLALEDLRMKDKIMKKTVSIPDIGFYNCTPQAVSPVGVYNIQIQQIPQAAKFATNGFPDTSSSIGQGTISLTIGQTTPVTANIIITEAGDSLESICGAINDQMEVTGVRARILYVDDLVNIGQKVYKLVLNCKMGVQQAITALTTISTTGDLSPFNLANLQVLETAQDGIVFYDNLQMTEATNVITITPGITLELLRADPGNIHPLIIEFDPECLNRPVARFVEHYNRALTTIAEVTQFNEKDMGVLLNDATMRTIRSTLRQPLNQAFGYGIGLSPYTTLASVGLVTSGDARTGRLQFNKSKLEQAFNTDQDTVISIFANIYVEGQSLPVPGFAGTLFKQVSLMINPRTGLLDCAINQCKEKLKRVEEDKRKLKAKIQRLEKYESMRFNAMDRSATRSKFIGERAMQDIQGNSAAIARVRK